MTTAFQTNAFQDSAFQIEVEEVILSGTGSASVKKRRSIEQLYVPYRLVKVEESKPVEVKTPDRIKEISERDEATALRNLEFLSSLSTLNEEAGKAVLSTSKILEAQIRDEEDAIVAILLAA